MLLLNETMNKLANAPAWYWWTIVFALIVFGIPAVLCFIVAAKRGKEEAEQRRRYEEWCAEEHYCPSLGENVTKGFCDKCTMTFRCSTSVNNN